MVKGTKGSKKRAKKSPERVQEEVFHVGSFWYSLKHKTPFSFVSTEVIKQARVAMDDDDGRAKWVSFARFLHDSTLNLRFRNIS